MTYNPLCVSAPPRLCVNYHLFQIIQRKDAKARRRKEKQEEIRC